MVLVALFLSAAAAPAVSLGVGEDLPPGRPLCYSPNIVGTSAGETLYGTAGNDVISGLGGDDTIYGLGGGDLICGGDGNDIVYGGPGPDRIYGGSGRDRLKGGAGIDTLDGGTGTDSCGTGETHRSCERPTVSQLAAACPSAAEVARINADLNITFESDPTSHVLACYASQGSANLSLLEKRAYNAVRIMQRIPFDTALPWTSLSLYDWFVSAIDGIRFRDDITYSSCCDPAGVINLKTGWPLPAGQATDLWINPDWNVGLAHLMILMVHEARHNEGYLHTCGGGTQDNTVSQLGSWGVQYYLQVWLADHVSPVFMRAPLTGNPGYYQWRHSGDAQMTLNASFCDE